MFYILTPAYQRQQQRDEDELKYRKERFEREKRDAEYYRDRAGAGYEDARGGDGLFTTAVEKRKTQEKIWILQIGMHSKHHMKNRGLLI